MQSFVKCVAAAATAMALTAGASQAMPYTGGSFGYGEANTATGNVLTTTLYPNIGAITVQSVSGNMVGQLSLGQSIAVANPTDFTDPASFNWSVPGLGSFAADMITLGGHNVTGSGSTRLASVTYYIEGNFTVGSNFDNAGAMMRGLDTFSLTQSGDPASAAISMSSTFRAPGTTPVPEPATLALLGTGLVGVAVSRRRKKKESA